MSPATALLPLLLLLIFLQSELSSGANVLFTFYHDRGSHFGSMLPLMEK
jgi:hypothetical protein